MRPSTHWLITERTVVSAILINSAALFALGFTPERSPYHSLWFGIDYGCIVYFAIEVVLKLAALGRRAYFGSGWNRLDFTVTVLSLPTLLAPFVALPQLSIVLVLRLGRLLRLLRLMRFIPNREHLAAGIRRALRASVGVFAALILVNIALAIGATFLFGELAPEHFGNPGRSIYSMFKVFTVEGWYEIPDLLAARSDSDLLALLARLYFIASVLIGGILGLSLANAVFVDEMMMDNTRELEAKVDALTEELRALRRDLTPGQRR